jgi:hypothetical protein
LAAASSPGAADRVRTPRDTNAGPRRDLPGDLLLANLETAPADARLCSCPLLHVVASALVPADGSAVRRRGARGSDKENSLLVVGRIGLAIGVPVLSSPCR